MNRVIGDLEELVSKYDKAQKNAIDDIDDNVNDIEDINDNDNDNNNDNDNDELKEIIDNYSKKMNNYINKWIVNYYNKKINKLEMDIINQEEELAAFRKLFINTTNEIIKTEKVNKNMCPICFENEIKI